MARPLGDPEVGAGRSVIGEGLLERLYDGLRILVGRVAGDVLAFDRLLLL